MSEHLADAEIRRMQMEYTGKEIKSMVWNCWNRGL